ncbi:TonB-dependent receptor [Erythrobacter sp. HI0037]|jgi:iron complex outermembrane receptor protein|uniref:TonB-dependent receptor n=1 Tax=Qipengyuania flava TaxID=192812 RepID=A0A3T1CIK2_9SPHN|nr:TonB-dependent receptor [Qipengyuania flava]KZX90082.1 TonB-dependent receptor [Erythrobacter sp. HI0020]KZY14814.1 TonB-dependent receptor [Erythrobacter sp. HI0038]KZY17647.1 TonB-dependent receptor [Erythrobacter sp. HI0037]UOR07977.1 TonB-dependent receptor [Qipengyuania flava]BBI20688.1 TonB-dependent receptor [Qipengyuania flava]
MAIRSKLSATVSLSACAVALTGLATPAWAQDAEEAADEGDVIIVSGYRASLESAIAEKREKDQIIESVSSEDIGKLPDASIGESIARLPGLTSQRISGRAGYISVRGFGPDFSSTLLNGRQQTSTNDNRGIEFDQYPSEIVSSVDVYKSPSADLIGQGLVGTIDIRTIRPLEKGEQVIAFGARGVYADLGKLNSGSDDLGYRVFGTYVDQFLGDTVGLALSVAYSEEPYQTEEFEAWGYADGPDGDKIVGGVKPFVTSSNLKRLGINGTVQYEASPSTMLTLDGFYSDFDDTNIKRGIEIPLAWSGAALSPTGLESTDGVITGGTFSGVEAVVNNHNYVRKAKLYSGGLNVEHEGEDGWNVNADISFSRTDRNELILESNAGTAPGGGTGATDTLTFRSTPSGTFFTDQVLDYSDPTLIQLTDPLGWGGGAPGGRQHGYYNDRIVEDELWQFQADIEKELDGGFLSSVQAGFDYVTRSKSLVPDEYFLQLSGDRLQAQVPSQYLLSPTNLDYLGLGPMVSYNPLDLLEGGEYVIVPNTAEDVLFKTFSIDEDIMTFFVQGNIESDFGNALLTGNFGVQAIHTDQSSTGFVNTGAAQGIIERTIGDNYWDILPSLNLSLRFDSDFVIRFAAAREIQRPRLDDMRVNFSYGVDPVERIVTGSGGNPSLRPYRATAFDLNFEKYFGNKGYLAAQLFYKKLHNYIYTAEFPFDYSSYPVVDPGYAFSYQGRISAPINGDGGEIYGIEAAGTLPFETFVSALEGFGVTGGVSYTKSKIQPDPNTPASDIPGYSRWVANGTAYFEKGGFSVRGSMRYRSTFLGDFSGFGANRVRRRAKAETIIDAQIGYDFQSDSALEGLSLFIQGFNLTNEPFVAINPGEPLQVMNYQNYGRRFMGGFTYKF